MSDIETTVQLEEAEASRENIPAELSFEEVIKNNTLSVSYQHWRINTPYLTQCLHSLAR